MHKSILDQNIRSVASLIKFETNVDLRTRSMTPRLLPVKKREKSNKKKIENRSLSGSRSVSLSRILQNIKPIGKGLKQIQGSKNSDTDQANLRRNGQISTLS